MTKLEKVLYTAKAHTTGGREGGGSRTSDGRLDVKYSQFPAGQAMVPTRSNYSPLVGQAVSSARLRLWPLR